MFMVGNWYPAVAELDLQDVVACLASGEECRRVFRQGLRANPAALVDPENRQTVGEVLGREISLGEVVRRMEAKDQGKFTVRQ